MVRTAELLDELRDCVGGAHVITDPDVVAAQTVDWTQRFRGSTAAVVRPADVAQVALVLRVCDARGMAVVPQGGNTGLVGASVPLHGEIVLDMRRLDALDPVDDRSGQVTAQAGVTIARLQAHAAAAGWMYGVDLAARDTATVGGTIATNAGGLHVLRYGPTRRQVVGVEAVLADGRVLRRLDGLEKDNTGYDLAGLLCGSEGTLAVVTAARLRLVPRPAHTVAALLAFDDLDAAIEAVGTLRRQIDSLDAIELFEQRGLDLVCGRLSLPRPFAGGHMAYVLVQAAAAFDPTELLATAVARLTAVADAAVAPDPAMQRALWRYREAHTEAINLEGAPHKLDVTLPHERLAEFVRGVRERVGSVAPDASVWLFGHAGDGNVHVNVTGVAPDDDRVTAAVLHYVAELHGSISAEHGIGTAKRPYLHLTRSPDEIAMFRAIKRAFDPRGTLQPHVLLPPERA
jgi:FAD/FMN-containing dehydrogenase